MSKFIVVFRDESEYVVAISATMADKDQWVRWFAPSVINGKDYPRLHIFTSRQKAVSHARNVVRYARRNLDRNLHYEVLPIYD